jgi:hypothetical protein
MNRFWIALVVAISLSACGVAVRMNAHSDMEGSKAAYKSCLAENPTNVSACEALRLSYEADLKAYQATGGGIISNRDP